jgi:hypothetical protein
MEHSTTAARRKKRIAIIALIVFLVFFGAAEWVLTPRSFNNNKCPVDHVVAALPNPSSSTYVSPRVTPSAPSTPFNKFSKTLIKFHVGTRKSARWNVQQRHLDLFDVNRGNFSLDYKTLLEFSTFVSKCTPSRSIVCNYLSPNCTNLIDPCSDIRDGHLVAFQDKNSVHCPNKVRTQTRNLIFCLDPEWHLTSMFINEHFYFDFIESTLFSIIIRVIVLAQ